MKVYHESSIFIYDSFVDRVVEAKVDLDAYKVYVYHSDGGTIAYDVPSFLRIAAFDTTLMVLGEV